MVVMIALAVNFVIVGDFMESKIVQGDWIRFFQNGLLIISSVEYIDHVTNIPFTVEFITLAGRVRENAVLEVRSKVV